MTNEVEHAGAALVDQVAAALVDPNLHTDARMRLAEQIVALLGATGAAAPPVATGAAASEVTPGAGDASAAEVMSEYRFAGELLATALTDPNLRTDTRMRLFEEIPRLIEAARR